MTGLSRATFGTMTSQDHLSQSIVDILTTPVGTRLMRRDYGSELPFLIDAPMNGETVVDLFMATADALDRWEPRLRLERVEVAEARAGNVELRLSGRTVDGPVSAEIRVGIVQ